MLTFLLFGVAYLQLFLVSARPIQVDLSHLCHVTCAVYEQFVILPKVVVCGGSIMFTLFVFSNRQLDRKIANSTPFVYQLKPMFIRRFLNFVEPMMIKHIIFNT